MTSPSRLPFSFSLFASSAVVLFASGAHALTCNTNTDCPKNYTCEATGASGGCAAPACAPGETCPVPNCETTTFSECVPGPCSANSDCADGMVCYSQTEQQCPSFNEPACAPNAFCPPVDPAPCTTKTVTGCVPQYDVPCTTDASCGSGFKCVEDQECACSGGTAAADAGAGFSGSAGSANSGGGGRIPVPPPTPEPEGLGSGPSGCTCTDLKTAHCELTPVTCTATSECPTGWLCEADPNGAVSNISGCVARSLPDGGFATDCAANPPTPVQLVCVPPYANLGYSLSGGELSGGTGVFTSGSGNDGAPKSSADGSGGQGSLGANPEPGDTATSASSAKKSDDSGCQMGAGHASSSGASLLGLLGLFGIARRRRSRAA